MMIFPIVKFIYIYDLYDEKNNASGYSFHHKINRPNKHDLYMLPFMKKDSALNWDLTPCDHKYYTEKIIIRNEDACMIVILNNFLLAP